MPFFFSCVFISNVSHWCFISIMLSSVRFQFCFGFSILRDYFNGPGNNGYNHHIWPFFFHPLFWQCPDIYPTFHSLSVWHCRLLERWHPRFDRSSFLCLRCLNLISCPGFMQESYKQSHPDPELGSPGQSSERMKPHHLAIFFTRKRYTIQT